jgi:ABC-type antimicrobial peptide transport system permease subunit
VGRRLRFEGRTWLTVVGVVGDSVHLRVDVPPEPRIVVPYTQVFAVGGWPVPNYAWLAARVDGDAAMQIEALRARISSVDGDLTVGPTLSMAELVTSSALVRYRFAGLVLGLFAGVAVLLAGVGIYGLMSFLVRRGRQEVGVRMALGARRQEIHRQIQQQGLMLTGIGLLIGLPAALALTSALEAVLYGVTPSDPPAFVATAALLLGVAFAASAVPARRATEVSPIEVLRSD